jgi:uncharacterized protein YcgI (DUF1989 family)
MACAHVRASRMVDDMAIATEVLVGAWHLGYANEGTQPTTVDAGNITHLVMALAAVATHDMSGCALRPQTQKKISRLDKTKKSNSNRKQNYVVFTTKTGGWRGRRQAWQWSNVTSTLTTIYGGISCTNGTKTCTVVP